MDMSLSVCIAIKQHSCHVYSIFIDACALLIRIEYQQAAWLQMMPVQSRALPDQFKKALYRGEAEAISLSLELPAALLLIDERKGRDEAVRQDLNIMVTLGVLLMARKQHQIADITKEFNYLRQIGFWFIDKLYDKVLALAKNIK